MVTVGSIGAFGVWGGSAAGLGAGTAAFADFDRAVSPMSSMVSSAAGSAATDGSSSGLARRMIWVTDGGGPPAADALAAAAASCPGDHLRACPGSVTLSGPLQYAQKNRAWG